jgi:hypothetical protein
VLTAGPICPVSRFQASRGGAALVGIQGGGTGQLRGALFEVGMVTPAGCAPGKAGRAGGSRRRRHRDFGLRRTPTTGHGGMALDHYAGRSGQPASPMDRETTKDRSMSDQQ